MHKKNKLKRDMYNAGASIYFLILLIIMTIGFMFGHSFLSLGLAEFVLLSLAIFRLIRLLAYDSITQFFRDMFLNLEYKEDGTIERKKHEFGLARTVSDILDCPWCLGIWIGTLYLFSFLMFPQVMYFATLVLAFAAVASMLQIIANWIGWNAEGKKKEVANSK